MRQFILVACMVLAAASLTAATQYESVTIAVGNFTQQQYAEGRNALLNRLRVPEVRPDEKVAIFCALAKFYCESVGDFREGLKFYQKTQRLQPDNAAITASIDRILSWQQTHAEMDRLIRAMRMRPNWLVNGPDAKAKSDRIETFIRETPDYYRLAEAYYCIGLYHVGTDNNLKAIDYFERAGQVKPAITFFVPLEKQTETVRLRWIRKTMNISCKSVFVFMLVLSAILFYAAKPWRWLNFRNLAVFGIVLVVLCVLVLGVHYLLAARYASSDTANELLSSGTFYLFTSPNSPGYKVIGTFMGYLIIGFSLVYVFALGTAALVRHKPAAVVMNAIAGTLILASLVCNYYMKHCDMKTENAVDLTLGDFFDTSNALIFRVKGIDPYILTEPETFPNPAIVHRTNPSLEDWAKDHCPFDEPDASEGK